MKEAALDKDIAYMTETSYTEAETGFDIHELENMYIEYLSEYEIFTIWRRID